MNLTIPFKDFISLFFPKVCLGCQNTLPHQVEFICAKCRYDLPKTNNHNIQIDSINEKFQNIIDLKAMYAFTYFYKGGLMQRLMYAFKYKGQSELAVALGKWYAQSLQADLGTLDIDLIVPVPLHAKKRKMRGFNQAERIADGIGQVIDRPVIGDLLLRHKMNESLTGLSKKARIKTMNDAYQLNDAYTTMFNGKRILLVDDVLTTGSTVIACYEALQKLKPVAISALVLAAAQ